MNLSPLYELKDRLHGAATAGVGLVADDFRLARAVEGIRPLAEASPIFLKIFDMAQKLIQPGCENSAGVLLDALALVDAVACTQGVMAASGEVSPIGLREGAAYRPQRHSALAPVITALTTTGGGRSGAVEEAAKKTPEILSDYRLRGLLVRALGDSYCELADWVAGWFQNQGDQTYLPLLKEGFDPAGKREMERRAEVIGALGKSGENEWYLRMLEEKCSPPIRAALIRDLRFDRQNTARLAELARIEKGESRKSALSALLWMDWEETKPIWLELVKKDAGIAADFLTDREDAELSELIAEKLEKALDSLLAGGGTVKVKDGEAFLTLLSAAHAKRSGGMLAFYRRACEAGGQLSALRKEDKKPPEGVLTGSHSGINTLAGQIGEALTSTLLWFDDPALYEFALGLFEAGPNEASAEPAFAAAMMTQSAQEVYERFGTYVKERFGFLDVEEDGNRSGFDRSGARDIISFFGRTEFEKKERRYLVHTYCYRRGDVICGQSFARDRALPGLLDDRWFDLLTFPGIQADGRAYLTKRAGYARSEQLPQIVDGLFDPENEAVCQKLRAYYRELIATKHNREYFGFLKHCGETSFRGTAISYIRAGGSWWERYLYSMLREFFTPADAGAELLEIAALVRAGALKYRSGAPGGETERFESNGKLLLEGKSFDQVFGRTH